MGFRSREQQCTCVMGPSPPHFLIPLFNDRARCCCVRSRGLATMPKPAARRSTATANICSIKRLAERRCGNFFFPRFPHLYQAMLL